MDFEEFKILKTGRVKEIIIKKTLRLSTNYLGKSLKINIVEISTILIKRFKEK